MTTNPDFLPGFHNPEFSHFFIELGRIAQEAKEHGISLLFNSETAEVYQDLIGALAQVDFLSSGQKEKRKKEIAELLLTLDKKVEDLIFQADRDDLGSQIEEEGGGLEEAEILGFFPDEDSRMASAITERLESGKFISSVYPDGELSPLYRSITTFGDFALSGQTFSGGEASKYNHNEDSFFITSDQDGNLYVCVIDGAGGAAVKGVVPSRVANRELVRMTSAGVDIREALDETSGIVTDESYQEARRLKKAAEAGGNFGYATVVLAKLSPSGELNMAWRGDARAAVLRGGQHVPEATTKMQNYAVQQLEIEGRPDWEYFGHPKNNIIMGGLGMQPDGGYILGTESVGPFQLKHGDQVVLASDGVWDVVSMFEIEQLSLRFHGRELQQKIIDLAVDRNSSKEFSINAGDDHIINGARQPHSGDNITVLVVDYT